MPDITRRGVTLTEAYQEAAAIAPVTRAMLAAYELWHPSMSEPIRFVNDKANLTATLEPGAPREGATEVTFLACPLAFERPTESDEAATPRLSMSRPDVGALLKTALDAARGSRAPWELIERVYASDDTSAPALLPPLSLELTSVSVAGAAGKIEAQFDDEGNTAVPRITFKRSEYPGLQR